MPTDPDLKATGPPRSHVDYLDGIRGVASLYVTLCHAWGPLFELSRTPLGRWGAGLTDYGHQAVDVFLVLSGFCLMLPVARHGTLAGGAWGFYARRARRILPPYFAALGLCALLLLLLPLFSHDHGARFTPASLAINALLLQDWFPRLAQQFDTPTWTVAVEWKIYFLFPLLVWLLRRSGPGAVLALTAVLGAGLTALLHHLAPGMPLDHTCPWFVALFGLGVCAGWATGRPHLEKWLCGVGAATLLMQLFLLCHPTLIWGALPWSDVNMGALAACLLALWGQTRHRRSALSAPALLSWRPLVFLGTFAYSLYLLHFPLLALGTSVFSPPFLHALLGHAWVAHTPMLARPLAALAALTLSLRFRFLLTTVAGLPLTLALSYLFFVAFERPFLNTRRRETPAQTARDAVLAPAP